MSTRLQLLLSFFCSVVETNIKQVLPLDPEGNGKWLIVTSSDIIISSIVPIATVVFPIEKASLSVYFVLMCFNVVGS
jgi:hypothetical protein